MHRTKPLRHNRPSTLQLHPPPAQDCRAHVCPCFSPSSSMLCYTWLPLLAWCTAFKLCSLNALHRTAWLLRGVINCSALRLRLSHCKGLHTIQDRTVWQNTDLRSALASEGKCTSSIAAMQHGNRNTLQPPDRMPALVLDGCKGKQSLSRVLSISHPSIFALFRPHFISFTNTTKT